MRMNRITQLDSQQSLLSEDQQETIQQLRDDIAAIRSESEVTPEQIEALRSEVQTLLEDVDVTLPERQQSLLSEDQQETIQQLRDDIAAIRSESEVTPEQIEALRSEVQTLLEDVDVTLPERQQSLLSEDQQQDLQQLRDDIAAIRSESEVTPEQIEALKTNIQTLLEDETIPQGSLRDYIATVAEYVDGGLTETEMAELTELTSNQFGLDPETDQAAIDGMIADVEAIVEASNIDQAQAITEELREDITTSLAEQGISLPEIDEVDDSIEEADVMLGRRGGGQLNGNGGGGLLQGGFNQDILTGDNGDHPFQSGEGWDILSGGDGNDPLTRFDSITQGHGGIGLFNGETRGNQLLLEDGTALSDSDGVGFGQGFLDTDVIQNLDLAQGDLMGSNHPLMSRFAGTGMSTETEGSQGLMGMLQTLAAGESNVTEDNVLF